MRARNLNLVDSDRIPGLSRQFVCLFGILFGAAFLIGIGCYWPLRAAVGEERVFGGLFRMFMYHAEYPAQYIAVVAFFYALFAAALGVSRRASGKRWHLGMLGVLAATLLLSSAVGGMLWTLHDLQAGFFPPWERRISMLADGVLAGVQVGWLIILLSFPYNVLTTVLAYVATYWAVRRWRPQM